MHMFATAEGLAKIAAVKPILAGSMPALPRISTSARSQPSGVSSPPFSSGFRRRQGVSASRRMSAFPPIDGVIGRQLVDSCRFWVLRFRLMVQRGSCERPQASEGEAQHGPFCGIGRFGQGDQRLHCG